MMNRGIDKMGVVPLCVKVAGVLRVNDKHPNTLSYTYKNEWMVDDHLIPVMDVSANNLYLLETIKTSAQDDPTRDEPTERR